MPDPLPSISTRTPGYSLRKSSLHRASRLFIVSEPTDFRRPVIPLPADSSAAPDRRPAVCSWPRRFPPQCRPPLDRWERSLPVQRLATARQAAGRRPLLRRPVWQGLRSPRQMPFRTHGSGGKQQPTDDTGYGECVLVDQAIEERVLCAAIGHPRGSWVVCQLRGWEGRGLSHPDKPGRSCPAERCRHHKQFVLGICEGGADRVLGEDLAAARAGGLAATRARFKPGAAPLPPMRKRRRRQRRRSSTSRERPYHRRRRHPANGADECGERNSESHEPSSCYSVPAHSPIITLSTTPTMAMAVRPNCACPLCPQSGKPDGTVATAAKAIQPGTGAGRIRPIATSRRPTGAKKQVFLSSCCLSPVATLPFATGLLPPNIKDRNMRRTCCALLLLIATTPGCVGAGPGSYFATQTPIPVEWLTSNPSPTVGVAAKIGQPQKPLSAAPPANAAGSDSSQSAAESPASQ